jgi:CO/xanthine dehydrogenase FAD-binding subunit
VKPPPFAYVAPDSVGGVVSALVEAGEDAKVLAGGQSLLPLLALRLGRPSVLVDVGRVPDLDGIRREGDDLVIGATATHTRLGRDPDVVRSVPLLAEVAPLVAHAAVRNRGTLGGSLAHNDPAAEWPAVALLLDATVTAEGPKGRRTIPAGELFESYLTTTLAPDEVLTEVRFPGAPPRTGSSFGEVSRRHGDFALVGAGARVTLDEHGAVASARLVFIGVGGTAVLDEVPGTDLHGLPPTTDAFDEVARAAATRLDPHDDLHATAAYRRRLAATLARRALVLAAERATGGDGAVSDDDDVRGGRP